ncbi:MAG: TetR/AcrR family transcriptional regulator [Verrucomicrobia bacterium]|nr:TetR/AcrR family transcriptional regulator [Verrucomicrobiota bacterium]
MDQVLAESAFRLFCQQGIARVTMDDIAADAGVTKGSLYWHYRSKAEVIEAACRHYYGGWRDRMAEATAPLDGPAAKLGQAIRISVRSCLIDAGHRTFTLELFTLSVHDAAVRAGWRAFFDDVRSFYLTLFREARKGGEIDATLSEDRVDLMLATMEGYKSRALFEPELCARSAEQRIARELLGIVGIGAPLRRGRVKAAAALSVR